MTMAQLQALKVAKAKKAKKPRANKKSKSTKPKKDKKKPDGKKKDKKDEKSSKGSKKDQVNDKLNKGKAAAKDKLNQLKENGTLDKIKKVFYYLFCCCIFKGCFDFIKVKFCGADSAATEELAETLESTTETGAETVVPGTQPPVAPTTNDAQTMTNSVPPNQTNPETELKTPSALPITPDSVKTDNEQLPQYNTAPPSQYSFEDPSNTQGPIDASSQNTQLSNGNLYGQDGFNSQPIASGTFPYSNGQNGSSNQPFNPSSNIPKGVNQTLSLNGSTMENEIIIRQRINPNVPNNNMQGGGFQDMNGGFGEKSIFEVL